MEYSTNTGNLVKTLAREFEFERILFWIFSYIEILEKQISAINHLRGSKKHNFIIIY